MQLDNMYILPNPNTPPSRKFKFIVVDSERGRFPFEGHELEGMQVSEVVFWATLGYSIETYLWSEKDLCFKYEGWVLPATAE